MSEDLVNLAQRWPEACWHQQTKGDAVSDMERLIAERDAARAEAERLRGETQRAVEAEREACARLFDGPVWSYDYREIAARIRARRGGQRFTPDNSGSMLAAVVWDSDGGWVRYTDHEAEMERLTSTRDAAQAEVKRVQTTMAELAEQDQDLKTAREDLLRLMTERDAAQAEVERLTAERDMARAEVRRLIAERDQPESRPKGRERGRFGWDGHYIYGMEPAQRTDEDIWREAFMTLLPSYPSEKASAHADSALAEYRKRWPR